MVVVALLALVLVAIPLYLWRRPRVPALTTTPPPPHARAPSDLDSAPPARDEGKLALGDARVASCDGPGTKKVTPSRCDRPAGLTEALSAAVEQSASCVPKEVGGGTIVYALDLYVARKGLSLTTPKAGRSLKNGKVVTACAAAVKAKLPPFDAAWSALAHTHYKLMITATYPGSTKL